MTFGLLLLLVGFGFKMSLAPFHAWAPDVYQGMPTPAVAYLSVAPKGASLLVLYRVLTAVFQGGLPDRFRTGIAALAILSMTLGNVVALAQRDIKRLLAYSGIAHMGYVDDRARRLRHGRPGGGHRLPLRLSRLERRRVRRRRGPLPGRDQAAPVGLLAGEGRRSPFAAGVLALCLFSLAGIPATAGFIGKFFVFKAAIDTRASTRSRSIGVVNSLISIGYYLKVVYLMYMRDPVEPRRAAALGLPTASPWRSAARRDSGARNLPGVALGPRAPAADTFPFFGP